MSEDKNLDQLLLRCKKKQDPTWQQLDWKTHMEKDVDITPPHHTSSLHDWVQQEKQNHAEWLNLNQSERNLKK